MLVIKCGIGDLISIGEDIEIRILGRNGGAVPLGIDAPRHVPVHRQEVAERIRAEGQGDPDAPRSASETKGALRPLIRMTPTYRAAVRARRASSAAAEPEVIYRRSRARQTHPFSCDGDDPGGR